MAKSNPGERRSQSEPGAEELITLKTFGEFGDARNDVGAQNYVLEKLVKEGSLETALDGLNEETLASMSQSSLEKIDNARREVEALQQTMQHKQDFIAINESVVSAVKAELEKRKQKGQ